MAAETPKSRTRKPVSGVVVPHKAKWYQRLAATLVYLLIRAVAGTIRFKLDDRSGMFHHGKGAPDEKIIFAIWHNRLVLSIILYQRYVVKFAPERRMAAIVSASKDGGFLAHILELFHVEPVRGSSSRRASQALREMITFGERGLDLAITPDGPRGPCYSIQEGVVSVAQLTGLTIVPVSYRVNWKIRLKSWDRFQIPLPFACCEITSTTPVRIPREATDAEREAIRVKLEKDMQAITRDD